MNKRTETILMSKGKLLIILSLLCTLLMVGMVVSLANRDTHTIEPVLADETLEEVDYMKENMTYELPSYGAAIGLQHKDRKRKVADVIDHNSTVSPYEGVAVSVFVTEDQKVETVPLEQYVYRVALAEIPLSFSEEAVKAQMLAIRTYIVHRMQNKDNLLKDDLSDAKYWVTDTTTHQVYLSEQQLQSLEDNPQYKEQLHRFKQALLSTTGQIIVYKEQPIEAVFFSTSNGYTEDAQSYWGYEVEYLQSVDSQWDKQLSPSFKQSITYSYEQLYERLGISNENNDKPKLTKASYTNSKRLASVTINGTTFTGKQIREKLELPSTHMDWVLDNEQARITFHTLGYGHGVGLSQWGANGMAQEGFLAEDIIKHYYKGVSIVQASKLVKNY